MYHYFKNQHTQVWTIFSHCEIPSILKEWKHVDYLVHLKVKLQSKLWHTLVEKLSSVFSIRCLIFKNEVCLALRKFECEQTIDIQILDEMLTHCNDAFSKVSTKSIHFVGYHLKLMSRSSQLNWIDIGISKKYLNQISKKHHLGQWNNLKANACNKMLKHPDEVIINWFKHLFLSIMRLYPKHMRQHNKTWKQFYYFWELSLLHSLAKKHQSSIKKIQQYLASQRITLKFNLKRTIS